MRALLHTDGRTNAVADGGDQLDTFRIGVGDTRPAIEATLLDASGEPIDLTESYKVEFVMWEHGGTVDDPLVESRAEIVDAESGHVRYEWSRGETEPAGVRRAKFRVVDDGGQLTVPNSGAITIITS